MSKWLLPQPWELRQIAYRVAPMPQPTARAPRGRWPGIALIVETVRSETLAGAARFGSYLLVREEEVLARGLFMGPAATATDGRALAAASRRLKLADAPVSLEDFLDLLFRYVYKYRLALIGFDLAAHLASLAADWGMTAADGLFEGGVSLILWTTRLPHGRAENRLLRNGRYEDGYRPRVLCKALPDGSVALGLGGRHDPDWNDCIPEAGGVRSDSSRHLLPLERFARALTAERIRSLSEACAALGVDPPPEHAGEVFEPHQAAVRCLARADAAHQLYRRLLERHRAFGLALPPDRVFSSASYAKDTLDAIGITPPMGRYEGDLLGIGAAMCAAHGGWSGLGVRSQPKTPQLPIRLIDEAGAYPVAAHELGIWDLLTSTKLLFEAVDPAEIEHWISRQRRETFRLSPELCVFCRLRPDGDVLPHRIRPGASWLTTVAPLRCEEALWWALPDLVNSFFETGALPKIEGALRLVGSGRLKGLRPVDLPGLGRFDPNAEGADLFLFLAKGRQRLERREADLDGRDTAWLAPLYKGWDNSGCSGIFLEVHPQEPTKHERRGTVVGPDGAYQTKAHSFEEPGRWFIPPFYSLVTAAGRLLLSLGMQEVQDACGCVVYFDTDSLAILATPNGGLIPVPGGSHRDQHGRECERALSYAEVDAIRWSLERHSPYQPLQRMDAEANPAAGDREPSLFRLEPENLAAADGQLYFYGVASKRKTPYQISSAGAEPLSPSEFALGHLLRPDGSPLGTDGVAAAWRWAALAGPEPDEIDNLAISHIPLTRHADLARLEHTGVRPWDTFVVAQVDRIYGTTPDGLIPRPVAIYRNGFTAEQAEWFDFASGVSLPQVSAVPSETSEHALAAERPLFLRTLRSVFAAHIRAPERKALGPDGRPCTGRTEGLLHPSPTEAYKSVAIGREANYSQVTGVLTDPDYTLYRSIAREPVRERVLTILRAAARTDGHAELAQALEVSESAARRYLKSGRARTRTHARALEHAAELAHDRLSCAYPGQALPTNPEALLYLATRAGGPFDLLRCAACNAILEGRQRRWCPNCRVRPRLRGSTVGKR
jgi:hypothetical protein